MAHIIQAEIALRTIAAKQRQNAIRDSRMTSAASLQKLSNRLSRDLFSQRFER
jgi:hypothetical protein